MFILNIIKELFKISFNYFYFIGVHIYIAQLVIQSDVTILGITKLVYVYMILIVGVIVLRMGHIVRLLMEFMISVILFTILENCKQWNQMKKALMVFQDPII